MLCFAKNLRYESSRVTSTLVFNKLLSKLATLLILKRSSQLCWRIFASGPGQKLKKPWKG